MAQIQDTSHFPEGLKGRRILLCAESFGPVNGVSRTTLMLVEYLRKHGANVAVVAPNNSTNVNVFIPDKADQKAKGGSPNAEVRVQGVPLPFNPELTVVYPVRLSALYARTFGCRPDLVYVASPASLGFQVLLQMHNELPRNRVPVICNFQTDIAAYCSVLLPWPFSSLATWTFNRVEGYLFSSAAVKTVFYPSSFIGKYLTGCGVQPRKMQLLSRGVNTELFTPQRYSESLRSQIAPDGEIVLICVTRLGGEKGFEFLAQAAEELDRRGLVFKLLIVGGNRNAAVEAEIHGLFWKLRRKNKVIFTGFRTGEALTEAFATADIFLHCSITETFGLVVLESMASGVPVVARDRGGPSDTVAHGESGFLVPPDNLTAFADKVMLLAEDEQLRTTMSGKAREQACNATWDKINNQVSWAMAGAIDQQEQLQLQQQLQEQRGRGRARSRSMDKRDPTTGHVISRGHGDEEEEDLETGFVQSMALARLLHGMGIIIAAWSVVGVYMVFIRLGIWAKSRIR